MNSSVYRVSLDIHKAESQVVLDMKKRDTDSRKIQINLTENGKPYRLTSDCLANFYAKKPDGNIIYNGCSVSAKDNLITYEVTEQTTSAVGRADCEIRLFDTEGRILTSPRFTILVHGTVYNEGDIIDSSSEVDAFQKLINNADVLNCFGVNYAGTLPTFKGKHSSKEITLIDLDNVVTRDNALRIEFDNKLAQHPTHENKSVLDNLGENEDGDLTYKGNPVSSGTADDSSAKPTPEVIAAQVVTIMLHNSTLETGGLVYGGVTSVDDANTAGQFFQSVIQHVAQPPAWGGAVLAFSPTDEGNIIYIDPMSGDEKTIPVQPGVVYIFYGTEDPYETTYTTATGIGIRELLINGVVL